MAMLRFCARGPRGLWPSAVLLVSLYLVSAVLSWVPSDSPVTVLEGGEEQCLNETCGVEFNPYGPLIKCSYLPKEFVECEPPVDHHGNVTAHEELGYGCVKFGGQRFEEVSNTSVLCQALPYIECHGNRSFLRAGFPCIKYSGHYFVKTLIYSVLLGFLGMDRFCLGHTGTAVGKLLTVGGVGIWWIVDVILLVSGDLRPADDSNWVPYY